MAERKRGGLARSFERAPDSAAAARDFVRDSLAVLGCSVDWTAAILLTNELVTNVIVHTAVDRFEVAVLATPSRVRIGVSDGDPARPVLQSPGPDDTRGRGLAMVDCLSESWGVQSDERRRSKCVWCSLASRPT